MDLESLKVILENLVDDLQVASEDLIIVEGPKIRKRPKQDNSYRARIVFSVNTNPPDTEANLFKLMELTYDFDLSKNTDEEIFANIGYSLIESRNKIMEALVTSMIEWNSLGKLKDNGCAPPSQREYLR